jgi:hypothetical protein
MPDLETAVAAALHATTRKRLDSKIDTIAYRLRRAADNIDIHRETLADPDNTQTAAALVATLQNEVFWLLLNLRLESLVQDAAQLDTYTATLKAAPEGDRSR